MTLDSVGLEAAAKVLAFRDLAADPDWHGVYEEEWAAQPEEYREAWRESVREVLAPYLAAVVPVTPTTENPEALTLAFWECGHVEVDRGVEHPCDRDVCSATYESYATVVAGRAAATPDPPKPPPPPLVDGSPYPIPASAVPAASPDERLREAGNALADAAHNALDPDPCWFDHNGDCQAHGVANPCETAVAHAAVAAWRAAADRDTSDGCRAPHCWSEYGTPCGNCPVATPVPALAGSLNDPCPECGATAGFPCLSLDGMERSNHASRVREVPPPVSDDPVNDPETNT